MVKTNELRNLLEYFGREQACYTSLLDLSRLQHALIEQGDMEQLLAVLGQKQQILARVADIEANLQPYKKQWDTLRKTLTDDDRSVVDSALATVEELLAELIELERSCEAQLVEQIHVTRSEIDEMGRARDVHKAYSPTTGKPTSHALDCTEA